MHTCIPLDPIYFEPRLVNIFKDYTAYKLLFIEHLLVYIETVVSNTIEKYSVPQRLCVKQVTTLL